MNKEVIIIKKISAELKLAEKRVLAAVKLMNEGNTLPFIARYRKEMTGSLTDLELRDIETKLTSYRNIEKRREEIITSITEQGAMTEELLASINEAQSLSVLEDLYLPYKKKRNTRAQIAKKMGLEPLALKIFSKEEGLNIKEEAKKYINEELGVDNVETALKGASDIIAEMVSDNAQVRALLRKEINDNGVVSSSSKENEGTYAMYSDFTQRVKDIPSHRVLAINRGEKEGVLKKSTKIDDVIALNKIYSLLGAKDKSDNSHFIMSSAEDAFDRLIFPSMENETFSRLFEEASEQAIKVFAMNLKPLLMQSPLKGEVVLGFDPAYRTGCKIAVVNENGKLLDTTVVYPTPPQNKTAEAANTLAKMIAKHKVTVIAIGNGTATKESEIFISKLVKKLAEKGINVKYTIVNEAGASVYSASILGAKEFPNLDVSLRSAVSIARRLQDPLAELVKIDPRSIGVGQYQHDMPQAKLSKALSGVVEDSVNTVGVDVNTASAALLSYVAGIGPSLAENIVKYREEIGSFVSRKQFLEVPKLGKKTFEQCAGFMRVPDAYDVLDNTAVHPESYKQARELLKLCGYEPKQDRDFSEIEKRVKKLEESFVAEKLGIGIETLRDIVKELTKPGRDPRERIENVELRSELLSIEDLSVGDVLSGVVRNVIDFGVFVDIGVHQDGLVHISKICNKFIKHPSEVLKVGDIVKVKIEEVNVERGRISLNMRDISE